MPAELHCNIDNWYLLLRGDWAAQLEPRDVVLMGKVGTTYVLLVQDEATAASAAAAAKRKDSGGGAAEAGSPGGGKGSGGKGLKGAEERAEARAAGAAAAAAPSSRDGALSDEEEEEEVSASRKLRAGSRGTSDGKGGEGGEDEAELPWVVAPGDEVIAIKDNMPVTRIQRKALHHPLPAARCLFELAPAAALPQAAAKQAWPKRAMLPHAAACRFHRPAAPAKYISPRHRRRSRLPTPNAPCRN